MAERTRKIQIKFRLSEAEAERFYKQVEKSGLTQQEYLLKCALNKSITNTDGIKTVLPELKRIGNNLNQVAKELHTKNYYNFNLITDNQKELKEIWQQLKQYLQKQA